MVKDLTFNVRDGLTLTLQNLWANVEVRTGTSGRATVTLSGEDELLNQIQVTQPSPDRLLIKEHGENDSVTVIQSGGRSSISVGNIRGSSVVIGGSIVGGRTFDGGVTIVNGKVVSGGNKVTVIEGGEMPTITITVPVGTDLEAYAVQNVNSRGLGGSLDISLTGQSEAMVDKANGMKVRCSGRSHIRIINASGNLKTSCSGHSGITVAGNLDDVEAEASGQSSVIVNGSCKDCLAEASGTSRVTVSGYASGKVHRHTSGMSRISIG